MERKTQVFTITEETEIKRNNGKEYLYNFEFNYVQCLRVADP